MASVAATLENEIFSLNYKNPAPSETDKTEAESGSLSEWAARKLTKFTVDVSEIDLELEPLSLEISKTGLAVVQQLVRSIPNLRSPSITVEPSGALLLVWSRESLKVYIEIRSRYEVQFLVRDRAAKLNESGHFLQTSSPEVLYRALVQTCGSEER